MHIYLHPEHCFYSLLSLQSLPPTTTLSPNSLCFLSSPEKDRPPMGMKKTWYIKFIKNRHLLSYLDWTRQSLWNIILNGHRCVTFVYNAEYHFN